MNIKLKDLVKIIFLKKIIIIIFYYKYFLPKKKIICNNLLQNEIIQNIEEKKELLNPGMNVDISTVSSESNLLYYYILIGISIVGLCIIYYNSKGGSNNIIDEEWSILSNIADIIDLEHTDLESNLSSIQIHNSNENSIISSNSSSSSQYYDSFSESDLDSVNSNISSTRSSNENYEQMWNQFHMLEDVVNQLMRQRSSGENDQNDSVDI